MLLGLAFPNSESNNTENSTQSQITIENVQSSDEETNSEEIPVDDTGGQSQPIPPKK